MPAYEYACAACGQTVEHFHAIGTAVRVRQCECGGISRLLIGRGVNISEKGFEAKGARVREVDTLEGRWDRDIPAYRRMRNNGMQPPGVDGAAQLENTVGDQFDIQYRNLMDAEITRERIREVNEEWHQDWANTPGDEIASPSTARGGD